MEVSEGNQDFSRLSEIALEDPFKHPQAMHTPLTEELKTLLGPNMTRRFTVKALDRDWIVFRYEDGVLLKYIRWRPSVGDWSVTEWRVGKFRHSLDEPAYVVERDGMIRKAKWYRRGKKHRTDGPAVQKWNAEGTLVEEQHYIDGERIRSRE